MKRHFVLDENVIVLAAKGEDVDGRPDTTCLELLRAIEKNCHALVLARLSYGRYSRQMKDLVRQRVPIEPRVMKILKSLTANMEKDMRYILDEELPRINGLEQLPGVDPGDAEFVRAAASVAGAILVTLDGPLIAAVTANAIDREQGFVIASPADALALAGPDSPFGS